MVGQDVAHVICAWAPVTYRHGQPDVDHLERQIASAGPRRPLRDPPAGGPRRQSARQSGHRCWHLLTAEREPFASDIDLDVEGEAHEVLGLVTAALEAAGAPKGSQARLDEGDPVTFGITEGLAVYLNGTDLPDEVYASGDINDLIAALLERLGAEGDMQSYWEGPEKRHCTCTARPPGAWTN